MSRLRIKKGDQVLVVSGDDGPHGNRPGKRGRVIQVSPETGRVLVEGVNMIVKHRRAGRGRTPQQMQTGRVEMSAPMAHSKVMLVCPRCDRPTRVAVQTGSNGVKSRVCKRCHEVVDQV